MKKTERLQYICCDDWFIFAQDAERVWYRYNTELDERWAEAAATMGGISVDELFNLPAEEYQRLLNEVTQDPKAVEKYIVPMLRDIDWTAGRFGLFSRVEDGLQVALTRDLGRDCALCGVRISSGNYCAQCEDALRLDAVMEAEEERRNGRR